MVYLGHTISPKSTTIYYKNQKTVKRPVSEQLRFENTHQAIIDKATWDIVQDMRKHKRRPAKMARQNELLFAKHINQKNSSEIRKKIMLVWRELRKLKRRDTELTTIFKRLYEDNVFGTIPNEAFRKLSADYLVEQKEIQTAIPIKERNLDQLKATVADVGVFL